MTDNEIRQLHDKLDLARAQLGTVTILLGRVAMVLEEVSIGLIHEEMEKGIAKDFRNAPSS